MIGGLIGGLVQLGLDLADGRLNSPRSDYIGAIAGGAFVGATGGLGGGSALSLMAAGAGGGAFGEATRALAAGERLSPSRIGTAAVLGGALSFPGARLITQRAAALRSNAMSPHVKGALGEQVVRRQYAAMGYFSTGTRVVKLPKAPRTPTGRTRRAEIDFNMRFLGIGPMRGVEAKFGTAHLTFNQRQAMQVDPFTVARVSPLDAAGLGFSVPGVAPLSFGSVIGGSIAAAPAHEPLRLTITPGG